MSVAKAGSNLEGAVPVINGHQARKPAFGPEDLWKLASKIIQYFKKGTPIEYEVDGIHIRTVQERDCCFFRELMTDREVMAKIESCEERFIKEGEVEWKRNQVIAADRRVAQLVQRWVTDKDPFSGFMMFKCTLNQEPEFVGHMVSGHHSPGKSEIAYYIPRKHWNKGFGTLAAEFCLQYLNSLVVAYDKHFKAPIRIKGEPLTEAVAIARSDNPYSLRIIENMKMNKVQDDLVLWNNRQIVYKLQCGLPETITPSNSSISLYEQSSEEEEIK